jgi:hypothetical protein
VSNARPSNGSRGTKASRAAFYLQFGTSPFCKRNGDVISMAMASP